MGNRRLGNGCLVTDTANTGTTLKLYPFRYMNTLGRKIFLWLFQLLQYVAPRLVVEGAADVFDVHGFNISVIFDMSIYKNKLSGFPQ